VTFLFRISESSNYNCDTTKNWLLINNSHVKRLSIFNQATHPNRFFFVFSRNLWDTKPR